MSDTRHWILDAGCWVFELDAFSKKSAWAHGAGRKAMTPESPIPNSVTCLLKSDLCILLSVF
jgi:hypothetical protein